MHGGMSPGAPKGNKNAFKHGRYSAEAIAKRREIAALLRGMKAFARMDRVEWDVGPEMMDGCGKFGGDNAYSNEKLLGRVSAESVTPCLPSERILDMSRLPEWFE